VKLPISSFFVQNLTFLRPSLPAPIPAWALHGAAGEKTNS
jgi:hypothetical protein